MWAVALCATSIILPSLPHSRRRGSVLERQGQEGEELPPFVRADVIARAKGPRLAVHVVHYTRIDARIAGRRAGASGAAQPSCHRPQSVLPCLYGEISAEEGSDE